MRLWINEFCSIFQCFTDSDLNYFNDAIDLINETTRIKNEEAQKQRDAAKKEQQAIKYRLLRCVISLTRHNDRWSFYDQISQSFFNLDFWVRTDSSLVTSTLCRIQSLFM